MEREIKGIGKTKNGEERMIEKMDYTADYNSMTSVREKLNEIIDVLNKLTTPAFANAEAKARELEVDCFEEIHPFIQYIAEKKNTGSLREIFYNYLNPLEDWGVLPRDDMECREVIGMALQKYFAKPEETNAELLVGVFKDIATKYSEEDIDNAVPVLKAETETANEILRNIMVGEK